MPNKDLFFKVGSGLKTLIGSDLISDDFIAVFELVKNAFDAHASQVKIVFDKSSILIWDDGKGMDFKDIEEKWLFVAYSAKKEGTEDEELKEKKFEDYRSKIVPAKYYAGAKGIGRFSCDRLGEKLTLLSKKSSKGSRTEQVDINWGAFDIDPKLKFEKVKVKYIDPPTNAQLDKVKNGTLLKITNLRSSWKREKILDLKHSLEKLINPFDIVDAKRKSSVLSNAQKFSIFIEADHEKAKDGLQKENRKIVNGKVQNFVFETLRLKTTQIFTEVSSDGKEIITELIDRGKVIYKFSEPNSYPKLANIRFHLYYLNQAAKYNFKIRMGISSVQFGSVFLYKNGFRVYPFGEEGEDSFGIDRRKQQGHSRYLGTREIIGRIEIFGNDDEFKETTSRDGGLKKTVGYVELQECFIDKCLKRLERYVVDIQWALKDDKEDLSNIRNNLHATARIANIISKLVDSEDVKLTAYPKDFLKIINEKLSIEETNDAVFENLETIARKASDKKFSASVKVAKTKFAKIVRAKNKAEERARLQEDAREKAEKELEEKISENLFLKSIKSQDFDEIVSFLHHIGISASINDNYLNGIYNRLNASKPPGCEQYLDLIRITIFENKKILNISKFATKANFKLYTDAVEMNLDEYIKEYIQNIVSPATGDNFKIKYRNSSSTPLVKKIRPIEINILIDNLISNAKKAGANEFTVAISRKKDTYEMSFSDDGKGIGAAQLSKIFDFGYTTTEGAGIGLYHIKEIVDRLKGHISVESKKGLGTKFTVTI